MFLKYYFPVVVPVSKANIFGTRSVHAKSELNTVYTYHKPMDVRVPDETNGAASGQDVRRHRYVKR